MTATSFGDLDAAPAPAVGHGAGGPAPQAIVTAYGFWVFLLSDIVMFAALFAAYAVLSGETAGGPSGKVLFDLRSAAIETVSLLVSSYTCGLGTLALVRGRMPWFFTFMALTFGLGALFLTLELIEFRHLVDRGAGPSRSAFLSAFFALVGTHGAHVAAGLAWLGYSVVQVQIKGPRPFLERRLRCFGLFWHALDIVWISLLTLVYLMGAR